jgi:hypothetical protein
LIDLDKLEAAERVSPSPFAVEALIRELRAAREYIEALQTYREGTASLARASAAYDVACK